MKPFIDFHVHPPIKEFIDGPVAPFDVGLDALGIDDVADHYRERKGRAVDRKSVV